MNEIKDTINILEVMGPQTSTEGIFVPLKLCI